MVTIRTLSFEFFFRGFGNGVCCFFYFPAFSFRPGELDIELRRCFPAEGEAVDAVYDLLDLADVASGTERESTPFGNHLRTSRLRFSIDLFLFRFRSPPVGTVCPGVSRQSTLFRRGASLEGVSKRGKI